MYIYGGSALNLPADCCDFSSVPKTIHEDTRHKWAWIWPPGGWSLAVGGLISLAARPEKKKAQAANDPGAGWPRAEPCIKCLLMLNAANLAESHSHTEVDSP